MKRYPVLNFVARFGMALGVVAGAAPLAVGGWLVAAGVSPVWLLAAFAAGAFAFLMLKSYADLVALILEMLLPQ